MGVTSKILMLLSIPSSQRLTRRHRIPLPLSSHLHRRISTSTAPLHRPINLAASRIHTQPTATHPPTPTPPSPHPWPDWHRLLDRLASAGYSARPLHGDDSFSAAENAATDDLTRAARACLAFARDRPDLIRLLSRESVEAVVENGSAFLFENGPDSERQMRLFLSGEGIDVCESEKAQTVDIMRYLLSYAYDPLSTSDHNLKDGELVEASVRSLLAELAELIDVSGTVSESKIRDSVQTHPPIRHEQISRPRAENIEMKRGDWICPKCSFMNFARNMRCRECDDVRPKKLLTGAEWECPQCDFFNYGRNVSCLRCDCKRPGETPSSIGYNRSLSVDEILGERRSTANDDSSNTRPEIVGGVGSDDSSESSISRSLDRILGRTSTQSPGERNTGATSRFNSSDFSQSIAKGDPNYVPFVPLPPDMFRKPKNSGDEAQQKEESAPVEAGGQRVDDFPEIMSMRRGENRFVVSKKKDRSLTSPQYKRRLAMEQANSADFVPFVPFPPDYFAKKDEQPETPASSSENAGENDSTVDSSWNSRQGEDPQNSSRFSGTSLEGSAVKEPDPLDMSEEAKAERWFRRAAQIKDISELSEIPDEDFLEIMPMRKGANRFVVSKRKTPLERRLTSPQYRRNLPIASSDSEEDDAE